MHDSRRRNRRDRSFAQAGFAYRMVAGMQRPDACGRKAVCIQDCFFAVRADTQGRGFAVLAD